MNNNIYLVKKLNPWMYEELLELSNYTSYTLVLLNHNVRYDRELLHQQIKTLEEKKVNVYTGPFLKWNFSRLFKFLFLLITHIFRYINKKSAAYGIRGIYYYVRLNKSLISEEAVIHAQFATEASIVAYLLKTVYSGNIRYSFTVHAYDIFFNNSWMPLLCKHAMDCINISEFNIQYIQSKFNVDKEKLVLSRLGVKPVTTPQPIPFNEIFHIGFLSWFVEKKGIFLLLESLKELKARNKKVMLHLAGGGALEERIKLYIEENNLSDVIKWYGVIAGEEKVRFFNSIHVFTMPSLEVKNDMDGIPVVLMEAVSYGVPMIATRVSGIPEICIDGKNGILVQQNSVRSLTSAIEKMISDEILYETLRGGAIETFSRYNLEKNTKEKIKLISWD